MRRCLVLMVLVLVGCGSTVSTPGGLPGQPGGLSDQPDTCRELVERLQEKGLKIIWHQRKSSMPSVWVFDASNPEIKKVAENETLEGPGTKFIGYEEKKEDEVPPPPAKKKPSRLKVYHHYWQQEEARALALDANQFGAAPRVPTAGITQYATQKEAKEKAGTDPNAIAYGRFIIEGNDKLVAQIKAKLGG